MLKGLSSVLKLPKLSEKKADEDSKPGAATVQPAAILKGLSSALKLPKLSEKKADEDSRPEAAPSQAPVPTVEPTPKPEVSQVVDGKIAINIAPEDKAKTPPTKYRDAYAGTGIAEYLGRTASVENADLVIAAAYKQIFGNAYLMDTERDPVAESKLRSGENSVLEFVRALAKSDRYRELFWEKHTNVTAIELNFKHLLGRAPRNYAEISEHIQIIADGGFEAEIDSYLGSDEYLQAFGEMCVPYVRGYATQTGVNNLGFTRSFSLFGSACGSDKSRFGGDALAVKGNLLSEAPGEIPELRAIPDSISGDFAKTKAPRVPTELRTIARELLDEKRARKGLPPRTY